MQHFLVVLSLFVVSICTGCVIVLPPNHEEQSVIAQTATRAVVSASTQAIARVGLWPRTNLWTGV